MDLLILLIFLSVYFIGLCMMVAAFVLCRRFPASLWLIKGGAYLAAAAGLLFMVVPYAVPWWDYSPVEYGIRVAAAVLPLIVVIVLARRGKGSFAPRNKA
jgi:hypothetical protein